MFIYNITFIVGSDKEKELLRYLRLELIPLVFNQESPAREPELRKVVETGGEKTDAEHGLSIALSATFPTEEDAHLWNDRILIPALSEFQLKFGLEGLYFVTLLQKLDI